MLCKICCSFSYGNAGNTAFLDKLGKLGERPSSRFSDHLNSNRHKLSTKNKQCFKEMSNRNVSVWELAFSASLQSDETKRQNNHFILKCFFKIIFLMIRKNWAHIVNFRDIAGLVADCGAKEISSHLLTAPKNAKYLSPLYVSKYIETMSNYMKQPLLENMRSNLYSFYTDETSDVTSIEQLAIYATFLRNQSISEHFIGLIPISKEVGAHLSAVNIMYALEKLFVKNDINLQQEFRCEKWPKKTFRA